MIFMLILFGSLMNGSLPRCRGNFPKDVSATCDNLRNLRTSSDAAISQSAIRKLRGHQN
jgi:hypothetical protein